MEGQFTQNRQRGELKIPELLEGKFENDLANSIRWSRFSLIATIVGVALMLAGGAGALIIGAITGPATGGIVGGVTVLAGTIINVFNHLVFNPARSATTQLNKTSEFLIEESKMVNALSIVAQMDKKIKNITED